MAAATAMLLGLARHAKFRRAEATILHLAADYAAALSQLLQLQDGSGAAFEYITSVLTNTNLDKDQLKAFQAAVKGSIAKLTEVRGTYACSVEDPAHQQIRERVSQSCHVHAPEVRVSRVRPKGTHSKCNEGGANVWQDSEGLKEQSLVCRDY